MNTVDDDDGFDTFWRQYPKKVGKDDARRAWKKRAPPLPLVLEALRTQDAWLRREGGRFCPNPATFINQGRWQDEPPVLAPGDDAEVREAWQDRPDDYGRTPRQTYEAARQLLAYVERLEKR